MAQARIVVVTEGGRHIWGIVKAIAARFGHPTVILENPESKSALLRRRARRLGWISAAGQLGTMAAIRGAKLLMARRLAELEDGPDFDTSPPPPDTIVKVSSANS